MAGAIRCTQPGSRRLRTSGVSTVDCLDCGSIQGRAERRTNRLPAWRAMPWWAGSLIPRPTLGTGRC